MVGKGPESVLNEGKAVKGIATSGINVGKAIQDFKSMAKC